MAKRITLHQPSTGLTKQGFYGFSWTTLFFGTLPALFRGDFAVFLGGFAVLFALGIVTLGIGSLIAMVVWAFMYNRYYTRKLIERGYVLAGSPAENAMAAGSLGMTAPSVAVTHPG
ncbi:hypothetical protein EAH89_14045 [Roseomonas nepalensis]|uniref:DUF2628 domain-containing protein n=1 Tax=Muricoccus nepalensis TaxID=1854500 RepID=A0A502G1N7_9PROT|nr:hypothetical protein [Roseomonas nepalensis]TPG55685.1 hypothetical protein EAH89_14045 [Roseomonas nepalensis]